MANPDQVSDKAIILKMEALLIFAIIKKLKKMQLFDPRKAIEESYVFFSCVLVKFLKNGRDQMTVQE